MPEETGGRRAAAKVGAGMPAEQEHLPCPRCDSTHTKFCYYNNYNFSQPRHFCKSCRRYWTHGGSLRYIPVGGAPRRNAKRSRILPPPPSQSSSVTTSSPAVDLPTGPFIGAGVPGSFTSLLGGLGLGIGPDFEDSGFGPFGRAMWAFPEVGYINNGGEIGVFGSNCDTFVTTTGNGDAVNSGGDCAVGGMNTWQMESCGGFVGGDCFSWPELAISPPANGNGFKQEKRGGLEW